MALSLKIWIWFEICLWKIWDFKENWDLRYIWSHDLNHYVKSFKIPVWDLRIAHHWYVHHRVRMSTRGAAKCQRSDWVAYFTLYKCHYYIIIIMLRPTVGGIKWWRTSDVCLSVTYIGPKSRTDRPRKTKIGTEVAHVTRDSDTTFKVKRSKVNLQGAQAYCGGLPHSLQLL